MNETNKQTNKIGEKEKMGFFLKFYLNFFTNPIMEFIFFGVSFYLFVLSCFVLFFYFWWVVSF